MSKLEGGIFSNPSGQTAGIVFGAARGRRGKVVTARQKVIPANPNTIAQQLQRNKFKEALSYTRNAGSTIYQVDWNRAVGQLPGFQSMMATILNSIDDNEAFTAPPSVPLGTLDGLDSFSLVQGGVSGEIDMTWTDNAGAGGTANDTLVVLAARINTNSKLTNGIWTETGVLRSAEAATVTVLTANNEYMVIAYFRGAGVLAGSLSPTSSGLVDSGA